MPRKPFLYTFFGLASFLVVDVALGQPFATPAAKAYLSLTGGTLTGALHLNDDVLFSQGNTRTAPDIWMEHDTAAAPDEWALKATDGDGGGTDEFVFTVPDGTNDPVFYGAARFGNADNSIVRFNGVGATNPEFIMLNGSIPAMRIKGATATSSNSNVADGDLLIQRLDVTAADTSGNTAFAITRANGYTDATFIITAGTFTGNTTAYYRTSWTKFAWTNAMIAACGAGTTCDIAVGTLPAKTIVKRVILVVATAATHGGTITMSVGRTGAAYVDFLIASDIKAAANTVYGDAQAEIGASLTGTAGVGLFDALPSYTGTTLVNAHLISTVADVNTVTTSTGNVFMQTELLP